MGGQTELKHDEPTCQLQPGLQIADARRQKRTRMSPSELISTRCPGRLYMKKNLPERGTVSCNISGLIASMRMQSGRGVPHMQAVGRNADAAQLRWLPMATDDRGLPLPDR